MKLNPTEFEKDNDLNFHIDSFFKALFLNSCTFFFALMISSSFVFTEYTPMAVRMTLYSS